MRQQGFRDLHPARLALGSGQNFRGAMHKMPVVSGWSGGGILLLTSVTLARPCCPIAGDHDLVDFAGAVGSARSYASSGAEVA